MLGVIPNPMFDVVGVVADKLGIEFNTFLGAVTSAKMIRIVFQAAGDHLSGE